VIKLEQEIKTQLKLDIVNWFKENRRGKQIKRCVLKSVVHGLRHEAVHYKIYKKFYKETEIYFELNMVKDDLVLRCDFSCSGTYPFYETPVSYPIYIFIEFVHTIFDIIEVIIRYPLRNIIYYLKDFIKILF